MDDLLISTDFAYSGLDFFAVLLEFKGNRTKASRAREK